MITAMLETSCNFLTEMLAYADLSAIFLMATHLEQVEVMPDLQQIPRISTDKHIQAL